MRFPLLFSCATVPMAVASLACSDRSTTGPSPQQSFTDQFCAMFDPCCDSTDLGTDGGACQAWVAQQAEQATFDGDAGAACLTAMQQAQADAAVCADNLGSAAAATCFQVFRPASGNVPPGGTCLRDSDCQAAPGGFASCYAALDFPEDGGAGGSTTHTCMQTNPGHVGDGPCLEQDVGDATESSWPSGQPIPDQTYTCNPSDGIYCDFTSHTCEPFAAFGGACTLGSQIACGPTGACVGTGTGTSGECAPVTSFNALCTPGFSNCGAGSHCSTGTYTCVKSLPLGSACTSDDQCDDLCVGGRCVTVAQATLCGQSSSGG